jgi:hypothetical protein
MFQHPTVCLQPDTEAIAENCLLLTTQKTDARDMKISISAQIPPELRVKPDQA